MTSDQLLKIYLKVTKPKKVVKVLLKPIRTHYNMNSFG